MKILHIITRLDRGGSADIALLTAREMERRGHEVYLISGKTLETDRQRVKALWPQGKIIYVEEILREIIPVYDLIAFKKLYSLIRQLKPDIVHTHSSKAGFLGRWTAWFAGTRKIIHMPHGHVFYGYYGPTFSKFIRLLEKITALISTKIITLTEIEAAEYDLLKVAPHQKLITIYNGIDLNLFNPENKFNFPADILQDDVFNILCVARLEQVKGHFYLLDAMPFILQSHPKARLIIAGNGSHRKALEMQSYMLNIRKRVVFLGERNDIAELLSISHIFVLPSLNEGLGIVLLEAQSMGVPIVATKVGGIPEAVRDGETGMLVPPKNSPAIAQAIVYLLSNPQKRKQFGESGKKWIAELVDGKPRFSRERMFDKIEQLYLSVV